MISLRGSSETPRNVKDSVGLVYDRLMTMEFAAIHNSTFTTVNVKIVLNKFERRRLESLAVTTESGQRQL